MVLLSTRKGDFEGLARIVLSIFMILALESCASKHDIVGKWREMGKTATIEFFAGGTFKAIDNQGMAVTGKYTLENETLRCEIQHEGAADEVVNLKISIEGDELRLSNPDGREVEKYRRVR